MDLRQLFRRGNASLGRMLPRATRAAISPQLATPAIVSSAKGLPSLPAAAVGVTGKVFGRVALPFAIYDESKKVFNPQDNIITRLGALGTSIENLSTGKPSSAGRTQAQQQTASRPVGTQAVLGGKPVYWGGDDYGWQQLNQSGSSATLNSLNSPSAQGRFIQDQGYSPAADRAYQQEVSRVAQLTAQDPELQRYEAARQKAVAAGPGSAAEQSAEDIGMQIWAQKYGKTLAPKVKPGQAGYDAIQRSLNAGQMGAPADFGAFTGTGPAGFLGNSGAPATSSYAGVKPVNLGMGAIGPNALTNAYNMQTASSFNRFMEGPTLSSQPLGAPTASTGEVPTYSQLSQPQSYGLGSIPGEEETFGSDASQKFANTYAKKLLNFQPI